MQDHQTGINRRNFLKKTAQGAVATSLAIAAFRPLCPHPY